jgi:cardiolipin synthase
VGRWKRKGGLLAAAGLGALTAWLVFNLTSGERRVRVRIPPADPVTDPQFRRTLGALVGAPFLPGNRVVELRNGDEILPAMLQAIKAAERTITLETYIYWSGTVGRQFTDALVERARAGVRVHVLVDWVGSATRLDGLRDELEAAGAQVAMYRPPRVRYLPRLNNRTHRKILVVDGRLGFVGGAGVGDYWLGNADSPEHWRESHFLVDGPVVAQVQSTFMDNWLETRGEVLQSDGYFPALAPAGDGLAQVLRSSPDDGAESIRLLYLLAIGAARRSVLIGNSYFLPDRLLVESLVAARRRGVRVEVLLPGPVTDVQLVNWASSATWGPLLEAGVVIYEYMPTMYHCKVMIVDEALISVGSANFDSRSFRRDDEANLNVIDPALARRLVHSFDEDKRRARPVSLEAWRDRGLRQRFRERVARLLAPQL